MFLLPFLGILFIRHCDRFGQLGGDVYSLDNRFEILATTVYAHASVVDAWLKLLCGMQGVDSIKPFLCSYRETEQYSM